MNAIARNCHSSHAKKQNGFLPAAIIVGTAALLIIGGIHGCRHRMDGETSQPVGGPTGSGSVAAIGSGNYEFTLKYGGSVRAYIVHTPPTFDKNRQLPAVLVLHGGGGTGKTMELKSNMNVTADANGFLAVYPDGTGPHMAGKLVGTWNAGRCCGQAAKNDIDDVGFISRLITQLRADFNVDPRRVYATGLSNGAQMSFRLACELSDKIAAIAPVGAQGVFDACSPKRTVPVIYFHGTEDHCSDYKGGMVGGCFEEYLNQILGTNFRKVTWSAAPAPEYAREWAVRNKVGGTPQVTYKHNAATCTTWGKDTNGEVTFCSIAGMGHTWPGEKPDTSCEQQPRSKACAFSRVLGPVSDDISANDAMWSFFKTHPLP